MPVFKPAPIDVENLASKLPQALQWPAGAIMGGLKSVFGGNDPSSLVNSMAPAAPLMAAETKGLGALDPMFTAVGDEAKLNAGRVKDAVANPLESVYQRMMRSGAGNNQAYTGPAAQEGRAVIGGASQEPHPAIRALLDTLYSRPEEVNPLKVLEHDKVGGFQVPHRTPLQVPNGFELPAETSAYPDRDPGLIDQFVARRDPGAARASDAVTYGSHNSKSKVLPRPRSAPDATPAGFSSKFELSGLGGWKP